MKGKTKGIYSVLRGGFLTDESSVQNWRIIFFVVFLLLVMIWSSHSVQEKVVELDSLKKLKKELRAEYIDTSTILMKMKLESAIRREVGVMGLSPAKTPPQKIKVTHHKQ